MKYDLRLAQFSGESELPELVLNGLNLNSKLLGEEVKVSSVEAKERVIQDSLEVDVGDRAGQDRRSRSGVQVPSRIEGAQARRGVRGGWNNAHLHRS